MMMKRFLWLIVISAFSALAAADDTTMVRLVVTLVPEATSVGGQVDYVESVEVQPYFEIVRVSENEADAAMALLQQRDEVQAVERDRSTGTPDPQRGLVRLLASGQFTRDPLFNDPAFTNQYYWATQDDTGDPGASTIQDAVQAADLFEKKVIAVVDSGFHDMDSFPWAGGYSFVSGDDALGSGPRFINSDIANCDAAHGQWVGSVIGGAQDDAQGNAGVLDVGTDADFYAARVLDCDNNTGRLSDASKGIRWAAGDDALTNPDTGDPVPRIEQKADLINVSLGSETTCPGFLQDAVDFAESQGAIVVASAGNSGNNSEIAPGNCDGVIAVGATNRDGEGAHFSTRGDNLAYSAAGVSVQAFDEEGHKLVEGTSFSAPLVVGMMANLWKDISGLSASELKQFSFQSLNKPPNFDEDLFGDGILDARKLQETAIAQLEAPDFEVDHPLGDNCAGDEMLSFFESDNPDFCDRRELIVNTDIGDRYIVLFETDGSLNRNDPGTTVHQASRANRFLVDEWEDSKVYGLQVCDNSDGTGCDGDTLVGLGLDDVALTCES